MNRDEACTSVMPDMHRNKVAYTTSELSVEILEGLHLFISLGSIDALAPTISFFVTTDTHLA